MNPVLNSNSDEDSYEYDNDPLTRLRFVRYEYNEKVIWWPVLLFESIHDLLSRIPTDKNKLSRDNFLDAHLKPNGVIAFLLGTHRPQNIYMICVPAEQMEHDLKDFYQYILSFEIQYERYESWTEALQEAVMIVFDHIETGITNDMPSVLINRRRDSDYGNYHLIPSNSDESIRNQDSFASQKESCIDKYVKEKRLHLSTSIPRGTEGIALSPSRPYVLLFPSISTILSNRIKDCSMYRYKDSELGNLEWNFAWDILCNRYG